MPAKMIPATTAARPAHRMRFAAVIFMVRSLRYVVAEPWPQRWCAVAALTSPPARLFGSNLHGRDHWQASIAHVPEHRALIAGFLPWRSHDRGLGRRRRE